MTFWLMPFVSNDAEILGKIESDNFRFNEESLLEIVNEYNLRAFKEVTSPESKPQGSIGFYTRVRPKLKEAIILKVCDSIQFKMPSSHYPLSIKLPLNVISKVCVSSETKTSCELIEPLPFAVDYYEIDYLGEDDSFEIQKETFVDFKNYMMRAKEN